MDGQQSESVHDSTTLFHASLFVLGTHTVLLEIESSSTSHLSPPVSLESLSPIFGNHAGCIASWISPRPSCKESLADCHPGEQDPLQKVAQLLHLKSHFTHTR